MKLTYDVNARLGKDLSVKQTIMFALQQMIAIMAATLLVPILISGYGLEADPAAALFGAGVGTLVYILFTKRRSPVFLGSSFTFLGAYATTVGMNYGYWGIILGVLFAGLVYVVIALIVKLAGSKWVNKIMPAVIIGPIVALIGLSLSGTATDWLMGNGNATYYTSSIHEIVYSTDYNWVAIICGLFTFFAIVFVSVKGSKGLKLIPFIIGVGAGYCLALIFTLIGKIAKVEYLQILSFQSFKDAFVPFGFTSIVDYPKFFFLKAIQEKGFEPINGAMIGNLLLIYVPIAVVELAQHISDHKNLGNIIGKDLIKDPGLDRTLLGDGVGSIAGTLFGGCANTTYGESIGCVAITGNASIITIIFAACGCILLSFFTPFVALINSIPKSVMGGACVALYGFIAVSGLQMLKNVDLGDNRNLFVVSAILVTGIGGMYFGFGNSPVQAGAPLLNITSLAVALIVGLVTNLITHSGKDKEKEDDVMSKSTDTMKDAFTEEQ